MRNRIKNAIFSGHCFYKVIGLSGPWPSVLISSPLPHKRFNQLNLFLVQFQSLCSCAHYIQWFTGYINHVDLLMSHEHVLKKLPYCLMCTYVVLWALSCIKMTNTCWNLTIKKQIYLHVFKVKNKYNMTSFWCFYCWLWP